VWSVPFQSFSLRPKKFLNVFGVQSSDFACSVNYKSILQRLNTVHPWTLLWVAGGGQKSWCNTHPSALCSGEWGRQSFLLFLFLLLHLFSFSTSYFFIVFLFCSSLFVVNCLRRVIPPTASADDVGPLLRGISDCEAKKWSKRICGVSNISTRGHIWNLLWTVEVSGSYGGEYEDYSLLKYSAIYSRWSRTNVEMCVLPPSSGRWVLRPNETSFCFSETTRRYIPEECCLHTRCLVNLKSHLANLYGEAALTALMMEAGRTSETSVYFNETTQRYIPEIC
jgi:hypothetical protein